MSREEMGLQFNFGMDSTGFQSGISQINRELKVVRSEFQASSAKLGVFGDETDKLGLKAKSLGKQLDLQRDAVKALEDAYEKSVQTKGKDVKATQDLEIKLNKAKKSMYDMESQLKQTNKQLDDLGDAGSKFDGLGDKFSEMGGALGESTGAVGEFVGSLMSSPWTAIAAGIGAVGTAAIGTALEFEKADGRIQASLGTTKEEAQELGKVAQDVWRNGWGESIDEVSRSLVTVSRNLRELPKEEIQKATEYAQILSEAFEVDIAESTRAANTLMQNFGLSATESFDYLTKGFQDGLDYSGEFLDSINEYAPQFKAVGMDSNDMFTIFSQGAENGAFNIDKLGDLIKEFNIRVKDGSKTSAAAFSGLSDSTQDLWEKFNQGKATGEEVFNAVVKDLKGMEDKVKANQLAVGIFGTQWEDLEAEVVAALDTSVNKLGEFEGATDKAGKALSDNISSQVSTKFRDMKGDLGEVADKFLYFALVTGEKKGEINDTFNLFGENVSSSTQKAINGFLDLNNKATEHVTNLKASIVPVTQQTADEVAKTFEGMATQVRDSLAKRQEEALTSLQTFFANTNALTDSEEANALSKMTSNYEARSQVITDGENRIKEILNLAKEEKRSITQEEATEINAINAQMKNQAIDIMTESEAEQKSILERLKVESGNITAQQAADVVKNSLKQKNESVKAAEDQYDKTVQEIIRQRDETGSISKEQADKLISEAKRQRDKSVSEAEIMHRNVVGEAKKQAKGQVNEIDWATGKMLGGWDKLKREGKEKWDEIYKNIKKVIEDIKKFIAGIKFKLPKFELPEMPHFSLNTTSKTVMGKKISYPTGFDVDWYEKGGVFPANSPRMIGIGDAKVPEAALPLSSSVLGQIGKMIAETMPQPQGSSGLIRVEVPVYLDSYQIAKVTTPHVNTFQADAYQTNRILNGVKR